MKKIIIMITACLMIIIAFVSCGGKKIISETDETESGTTSQASTKDVTTEVEITAAETEVHTTEEVTDTQAVTTEKVTTEVVTTEVVTTEAVTTEPVTTEAVTTPPAPPAGGGGGGFVPPPPSGGGAIVPPVPTNLCANGHDEEQHEAKTPTCTEVGWEAYVTCKREGCDYSTKVEIPASHDEEQHEAKAATCTEAGWNVYVTCKRNGCDYSTKVEIPASHDEEQHEAKAVTCTEAGWDAYVTCKRNGCDYSTKVEIPASHDEEQHEAKAATCTEIGWEAYVTCKREGCEYTTYVEIPITHAYVSGLCSCGDIQEAINLKFESNGEGTCSVIGIGTCSANYIKIPETSPEGDAVTAIGENAFENCSNLKSIVIPTSVKDIEEQAFLNCNGLKKIEVPNSVTTIELGAFKNCSGLESITLPFVGRGSFYSNFGYIFGAAYAHSHSEVVPASLKTVIITGGGYIDYIGADAFEDCANIETIVLSEGITSISKEAFDGCNSLKTINIPDSVTSIGESAFRDCSSLEKIEIPARVTIIGQGAFIRCNKLESITIPNATTHLGQLFGAGNYTYNESNVPKSLKEVIITGGTEIADNVFYECSSITTIEIPSSVTNIGDSAFYDCSSLDTINYRGTKSQWNSVLKGDDWNYKAGEGTTRGSYTLVYNYGSENPCITSHSFTTYVPNNNATCLNDGTQTAVCDNCDVQDTVSIVGSALGHNLIVEKEAATVTCTTAGKTAVMGCERCEYTEGGVSVPELKHKFDETTGMCDNCGKTESKNLEFGYKDGSVYVSGLGSCTDKEIIIPSKYLGYSVTSIGEKAFYNRTQVASVEIPDSVTAIEAYAFSGCTGLKNIEIPSTVIFVGKNAFDNCTQIIKESNGVYYVDKWVTYCNSSITKAVLKSDTVGIANEAFYACLNLVEIEIPNTVKHIGRSAFYICYKLENVKIPESVTSIGKFAFWECEKAIEIEEGVSYVDKWAIDFDFTLTTILLRDDTVGIAEQTFYDSSKNDVVSITIPSEVKYIGEAAFFNATKLRTINYPESEVQWNAIVKGTNWDYNTGSETVNKTYNLICNYGSINYVSNGDGTCYVNGFIGGGEGASSDVEIQSNSPTGDTVISVRGFYGDSIETVRIPATVISIDNDAFGQCDVLTNVIFADNSQLKNIGKDAFYGCEKLKNIEIPASVTSIGKNAFRYCYKLTNIAIPSGVTSIEEYTFDMCSNLKEVTFGANSKLTSIGKHAFSWCESLEEIVIPANVESIGESAFDNCYGYSIYRGMYGLTSVTIEQNSKLSAIGKYAFYDCLQLKTINIPMSITYIGEGAFSDCIDLHTIYYEGSETQWGIIEKEKEWDYEAGTDTTTGKYTVVCNYISSNEE